LQFGGILAERDDLTAEEVWPWSSEEPAFSDVCFEQFKEKLKVHQKQANCDCKLSFRDALACQHDRMINPRKGND
jgi:hypothetical protein